MDAVIHSTMGEAFLYLKHNTLLQQIFTVMNVVEVVKVLTTQAVQS